MRRGHRSSLGEKAACQTPLLIGEDFRDRAHIPGLHLLTHKHPWKLRSREREPGGVGAILTAGQGAGTGRCPSLEVTFLPSSNTKIPKATRKEARLLGCHQLSARPGFVAHQLHRALQKVPWLGLLGFLKTNKSLGWHILEAAKRAPSSYILASGFLLPSQESLPSSGPSGHRPGERQVPGRCETTV